MRIFLNICRICVLDDFIVYYCTVHVRYKKIQMLIYFIMNVCTVCMYRMNVYIYIIHNSVHVCNDDK
jgi:hypothetical protein